MPTTKTLNTRISLKYDLYNNWITNDPVLLKGEMAVAYVPATTGAVKQEPALLLKVGEDGVKKYSELPFVSAKAADVNTYALMDDADFRTQIESWVAGKVQDTNTTYQIIKGATDYIWKLQKHDLSDNPGVWTDVSTITIPEPTEYTLVTGTENGTVSFNGQNVAVAGLKSAAYEEASAFDAAGSAVEEAGKVLGSDGDTSATNTVFGAKKAAAEALSAANEGISDAADALAEAQKKVSSVGAGDASILIGGSATAPSVAVKVSANAGNALELVEDGLMVSVPTAAEYSIVKDENSGDFAAIYHLTKDGSNVGAAINIPKDMVVESGSVVTNPEGQPEGTYIELRLQNVDEPLYINVTSLIEYVTSGSSVGDMVFVTVSDDHKITATITDGTITLAKLDASVQTSINKADSALQSADVTTGSENGTIAIKGNDVPVAGLGSAAFEDSSAFDAAGVGAEEAAKVQTALLGSSSDGASANTIYGAKAYAKEQADNVADNVSTLEGRVEANEGSIGTLNNEMDSAEARLDAVEEDVALKANDADLAAIAKTGNVNDLVQGATDVLVLNCGTSSEVF